MTHDKQGIANIVLNVRSVVEPVNSWKLISFLHYLVTLYFVVDVKCGIAGGAYRLLEVMIFFVIPKLQHFISFVTVGTLE